MIYTYDYDEEKFNNVSPRFAKQGITVYAPPGKYCGAYGQPC